MGEKTIYTEKMEARDSNKFKPTNETPLIKEDKMEATENIINHNVGNGNKASEMKIENVPINSLLMKYHPRNTLGDIECLQGSIKRDGLQEPLLVYNVGENQYAIIDGVRRLAAVKEFGWQSVPCLIKKGMDASDAAHLSYVKNKKRKSFTPIETASHLKAMQDQFGYSLRELEVKGYGKPPSISNRIKLLELPESVQKQIEKGQLTAAHGLKLIKLPSAEEQEIMAEQVIDNKWTAKKTDIRVRKYLKKGKKEGNEPVVQIPETDIPGVYMKDSRDMSELADKSVHLIVTSPPYCVGMEFEKGISYAEHWENMKEVMAEASRVLVPGGIMALNVGDIHNFKGAKGNNKFSQIQLVGHIYQSFLRRDQVYLSDIITWVKSTHAHSQDISKLLSDKTPHTGYRILISQDPVYIFRKKGARDVPSEEIVLNSRITRKEWSQWASGIWMIGRVRKMEGHPAIFPDELLSRLVRMFSYEGDTVLDPFLGSGTTIKVARELNREGIGYERELQYKPVIMKRLGLTPEKVEDESSETMVEFFERIMPSANETTEPSVEATPVDTRKQVQSIESAEKLSEMGVPV